MREHENHYFYRAICLAVFAIIVLGIGSAVFCTSGCGESGQNWECGGAWECDDGVGCTHDRCLNNLCDNEPFNTDCADDEVCDAELGCVVVVEPECDDVDDCDDGHGCTRDECVSGVCLHEPDTDHCEGGFVCLAESGCVPEAECARDRDCDEDGNDCNDDRCVDGACEREPSDELCASGYVCDESGDCVAGNEGECDEDDDCEDGVACTVDVCIYPGVDVSHCDFRPSDQECEDWQRCDFTLGCVREGWVECETSGDCIDGVACTSNSCVSHLCRFEDSCADGFVCSSSQQACVPVVTPECVHDMDCDDGVDCTSEYCDNGECQNDPISSRCDDGIVCTSDTCTASGCIHAINCTGGEHCLATGECVECAIDAHCESFEYCSVDHECVGDCGSGSCDDGVACTDDVCVDTGTDLPAPYCANTANSGRCSGALPFCHLTRGCVACLTDAHCASDEHCDSNACVSDVECTVDSECSDGIACTIDDCDTAGRCLDPLPQNSLCSDGVACTLDICSLTARGCTHEAQNSACGSSLPYCHATRGCVVCLTSEQCGAGKVCTAENTCVFAPTCGSCDDSIACTLDDCTSSGVCTHTSTCAAGMFCFDGYGCVECRSDADCFASEDCRLGDYTCVVAAECDADADCSDGVYCTVDDCNASGSCTHMADNGRCSSGQYCDASYGCRAASGPDRDSDGVPDASDNCSSTANPRQEDMDGDHIGDVCDCDADGDLEDQFPCGGWDCNDYNPAISPDTPERCADGMDNDCDDYIDETASSQGGCSY